MKIKDYKCKCGCNDFFFADKGNQKGIYCTKCGKWLKWADKDEKNLIHCLYTDEEIAKSFIEDVEAVKDQLPCGQMMEFPKTFDDFARDYGFKDKNEIYTNGSELIPVFRVKQWLEHISTTKNDIRDNRVKNELNRVKDELEPTTKNDLAVSSGLEKNSKKLEKDFDELDCISRKSVITIIQNHWWNCRDIDKLVNELPSVTPQAPRWIPVSERLPKDRNWYLGIFKESDTGWINPLPFICDYVGSETKATTKEYWILRGFTDIDEPYDYYLGLECVAWQPLPKPYKEGEVV